MLSKMRMRRVLAIALAVVMALSTPLVSFADESAGGIVEEGAQAAAVETAAQEPSVAETVAQEIAIEEVQEEPIAEEDGESGETAEAGETTETEETAETEGTEAYPSEIILEDTAEDGMKVTLKADPDTFEYSEGLTLDVSVVSEEEAEEADKELKSETKDDNVAKRVTYDIRVMYGDEELEPLDGKKVKVEFTMSDIPSGADAVNVYHIDEEDGVEIIVDEAPVNEAT